MAVKMRLRRMGQKKAPFYRIIVADSRDRKSTRLNSSHANESRMPSSA